MQRRILLHRLPILIIIRNIQFYNIINTVSFTIIKQTIKIVLNGQTWRTYPIIGGVSFSRRPNLILINNLLSFRNDTWHTSQAIHTNIARISLLFFLIHKFSNPTSVLEISTGFFSTYLCVTWLSCLF